MQLVSEGSSLCLPFAFLSASRQPGPRRGLGLWFRRDGSLPKVSFDAPRFQDIAFAPQILVRWLSGRKRRFAKALYLKRVPRVRIPASPVISDPIRTNPAAYQREATFSKAKLGEFLRTIDNEITRFFD